MNREQFEAWLALEGWELIITDSNDKLPAIRDRSRKKCVLYGSEFLQGELDYYAGSGVHSGHVVPATLVPEKALREFAFRLGVSYEP